MGNANYKLPLSIIVELSLLRFWTKGPAFVDFLVAHKPPREPHLSSLLLRNQAPLELSTGQVKGLS